MVPCGIADVMMTSVERELLETADEGRACLAPSPSLSDDVRESTVQAFGTVFGATGSPVTFAALDAAMGDLE